MKKNNTAQILSYFLPRIQDMIFICILLVVCLLGSKLLNADGDLGRHITIGEYMLKHGIPYYDIFSYTMTGKYLVSHEWLAQISFGISHTLMGLSGAVLLTAILISITFTLVYHEIVRRNGHYLPALLITMLAAFASMLHWLSRPHIFTFFFIAVWAYNLQKISENDFSKIWKFPLLMLVWANTHGAFIAGFVILAAYFAGWLWEYLSGETDLARGKMLLLIGVMSFVVTFINPYGWHLWGTSAGYFGNQFLVDRTIEYQSPDFHDLSAWPFMIILALSLIAPAFGRKLRMHEVLLLAGWCMLGLFSKRNIPLFAIITAPYLAFMLQPLFDKFSFSKRIEQAILSNESQIHRHPVILPSLAVLFIVVALTKGLQIDSTGLNYNYDPEKFPVEAVRWLETHPQGGNMFNQFIWGGYLLYSSWPQQRVFIDGQTDFYGEALTLDYASVAFLEDDWEDILTKHDISWAIIASDDKRLIEAFEEKLNWTIVYKDNTTTILDRP